MQRPATMSRVSYLHAVPVPNTNDSSSRRIIQRPDEPRPLTYPIPWLWLWRQFHKKHLSNVLNAYLSPSHRSRRRAVQRVPPRLPPVATTRRQHPSESTKIESDNSLCSGLEIVDGSAHAVAGAKPNLLELEMPSFSTVMVQTLSPFPILSINSCFGHVSTPSSGCLARAWAMRRSDAPAVSSSPLG